ncbi:hypothetical protein HEP86_21505 [Streptomyces sp. RPA4-5]|uniref:hypothetical protein n=1 Tax=Streptomyces TaxID=1883 RepID=UPI00143E2AF8|nr:MULTISPECIES: hypothetical protein [Streptomyces]MCX4640848.1 hypothetical protein [Streptomyces platensis]QIY56640.1 hypothetical protein HEP86_21505 [Streptomyces sp. RPA4-5]
MKSLVAFTVLWAGVVAVVNRALDDVTWAQYLAIFALGGVYAFTVNKVPGVRGKRAQEGPEA